MDTLVRVATVSIVDVERFTADGYAKLGEAAPRAVADLARCTTPPGIRATCTSSIR